MAHQYKLSWIYKQRSIVLPPSTFELLIASYNTHIKLYVLHKSRALQRVAQYKASSAQNKNRAKFVLRDKIFQVAGRACLFFYERINAITVL